MIDSFNNGYENDRQTSLSKWDISATPIKYVPKPIGEISFKYSNNFPGFNNGIKSFVPKSNIIVVRFYMPLMDRLNRKYHQAKTGYMRPIKLFVRKTIKYYTE